ncbi:MAG: response regulator [Parcubacteria group bacterium CG10_big_fil_rev_8_21_14_0_10_38_31]|uniref:Response regulator n=1 Tax=Candidatus Falkowbacteria bacterium CG11_big_fil_rev_8_21_14_0_20_39_10 TaxID=1974570 RepID=A0A2M6KA96_9BACT|nr:MAG: response regulator [Candidatus Falkowbacteria bacterium CG11_big_fil_rev_8_21_14_0_20_39_10]PIR58160.1 MAG: response regulator [Parcubacteria group bacterium CG10_big_fil_rev_8_21_14_0_10_38_31]
MGKKKKILFIEDERHFQEMLDTVFKAEGFETVSAFNGVDGVRMAEEEKPDIILSDLVLPKKDGFNVINELKNNPNLSDTPIIILTNLEESQNIEKVISSGAKMYLVKANYTLDDIVAKVKDTLKINNKEKNEG